MSCNSPGELDQSRRLGRTRAKNCLIVQTTLALSVVTLGIKLGKLLLAYLYMGDPRTALKVLSASWLVRIFAVVVVALIGRKVFCPRRKWLVVASPFIVLVFAKLLQVLWTGKPSVAYGWLVDAAKQFWLVFFVIVGTVRRDVVFLGSFAIFVWVIVALTPSRHLGALRILLTTWVASLLLLSGLELAQYYKTGVTGTGHLLGFLVTNAGNLCAMLRSEIDVGSISALAMPLIVGSAIAHQVRKWFVRREGGSVRQLTIPFVVVLGLLLAAEFIAPPLRDHRFDRFVDNTYLGLRDLIPWRKAGELEAVKRASRLPVIFDTSEAALCDQGDPPAPLRDVIIIMLESARACSTSIYDSTTGTTPFLTDFAKRGAVVPEMYSVIPRTPAAWVAVLYGIWPSTDEEMMPWTRRGQSRSRSLPALLGTRGYVSAFFTTTHLSFDYNAPLIKNMGFETVQDADTLPKRGFEEPSFWGFEDRMMLEPSLNWVKQQRDRQRPFLLVMMTNIGHYNYQYPSKWRTRSFGTINASYNDYLNCLGYIDSVVKDLINGLDELGVLRSSIVIILGDHGESFGEHGPRVHSLQVYDETVKIPAILYSDGLIAPGTSISGLRQQVDIVPTVFDALGLTTKNANLPGTSMLKPVPTDRPLYFSGCLYSQQIAMRKGGLKFVYNFERIPTEAFEIEQDSGERHDIASTLPRQTIEEAEFEMLLWRERVSRVFVAPPVGEHK